MKPPRPIARAFQLVLLATVVSLAAGQSHTFPPTGRFVLHGPKAGKIFDQCSRAAPSANSALWEPSAKDIDELEVRLAKYLDERERTGKQIAPTGTKYHRQYVGFTRNGERFVYGNFYPADLYSPAVKFRIHESKEAVQICDGGSAFRGIVYQLKTKTFEEPQFNGVA